MSKIEEQTINQTLAEYYDKLDIMSEILDESIDLTLDSRLRKDILSGKRKRRLKNLTIKMDPIQIQAIRKIATIKSIPYQTLIRHWIAQEIKKGRAYTFHLSDLFGFFDFLVRLWLQSFHLSPSCVLIRVHRLFLSSVCLGIGAFLPLFRFIYVMFGTPPVQKTTSSYNFTDEILPLQEPSSRTILFAEAGTILNGSLSSIIL